MVQPSPTGGTSRSPPPGGSSHPSRQAWWLGAAGLLPFAAGALLVWLVRADARHLASLGLAAYGAVIVSFLGGIHWGLAMRQPVPPTVALVWGVVPSLLAALALLMAPPAGLVVLGAALLACYAVDRRLYPPAGATAWLPLRFRLSATAALCCFLGAAGA